MAVQAWAGWFLNSHFISKKKRNLNFNFNFNFEFQKFGIHKRNWKEKLIRKKFAKVSSFYYDSKVLTISIFFFFVSKVKTALSWSKAEKNGFDHPLCFALLCIDKVSKGNQIIWTDWSRHVTSFRVFKKLF